MPPSPDSTPTTRQPVVVRFTAPRSVDLHPHDPEPLLPGHVRVSTIYSGISAGTELTAYRGSNAYLNKRWDDQQRLFTQGAETFSYPLAGWGYSEVGRVIEVADDCDPPVLQPGDVVYGIWGHRSEAVLPAAKLNRHRMADDLDPLSGVFARVGAIALNAVLAAGPHLGADVAVFGQGVLGLLATRLTALSGARVTGVDMLANRLELSETFGASRVIDAAQEAVAEMIKGADGAGLDSAIEISGSYRALHEAVRSVAVAGKVIAAGFYQGEATGLALGEEFHHNRVQILASQIGGVPTQLSQSWDVERLQQTFMGLVQDGRVDVQPLISHVLPATEAASAFDLLDQRPGDALQVVLDFEDGTR